MGSELLEVNIQNEMHIIRYLCLFDVYFPKILHFYLLFMQKECILSHN